MTVHVTIEMDEAVKAKLDALSNARGRAPGELLVEALERIAVEHDTLALALAVDEARASLASGFSYSHEEVAAAVMARRQERAR